MLHAAQLKMKRSLLYLICILCLTLTVTNSCKKYPDGPKFSLQLKKTRLCGDWSLASATLNGNDITATLSNLFLFREGLIINKDGTYETKDNFKETGKWEFEDHKKNIHLTVDGNGLQNTYTILKLENKDLWWEFKSADGNIYIWKFKQ